MIGLHIVLMHCDFNKFNAYLSRIFKTTQVGKDPKNQESLDGNNKKKILNGVNNFPYSVGLCRYIPDIKRVSE